MANLRELNIQILPSEVLENIASYLKVQSALAWSATSNHMRNTLNKDWVWKRYGNFDEKVYNSWGEPRVRPIFNDASCQENCLSSCCKWKTNYFKQAHLMKNWTQGIYNLEEAITMGTTSQSESDVELVNAALLGNHHLFAQIWDIQRKKMVVQMFDIQQSSFFESASHDVTSFHSCLLSNYALTTPCPMMNSLEGNSYKVILTVGEVCRTYKLDLSTFTLKVEDVFLFDQPKLLSSDELKSALSMHELNPLRCITQNHFIGAKRSDHGHSFEVHIWDFHKAEKLKTVSVPPGGEQLTIIGLEMLCSEKQDQLILKLSTKSHRHSYHYYGFDLTKMEFSSFKVQLNYCAFELLAKDRAVGVGSSRLFLYNYQTSEKIVKREHSHTILTKTVVAVGDHLLYGLTDSTVFVLDISSGDVVNKVKLNFTLYRMIPILDKFVIVNTNSSWVMQIGKEVKYLFKLPVDSSFAAINKTGTKMAVKRRNQIIILNFW